MFFDKTKHKIQIIAPSSPAPAAENNKILEAALSMFEAKSIKVNVTPNLCTPAGLPYYANNLEFRVSDFKKALTDDDVKIIWTFRGGYGAAEVAESIHIIPAVPKVIIGFSDITVLHTMFNQKFNMPTIHGEVINRIVGQNNPSHIDTMIDILNNKKDITYPIKPMNKAPQNHIDGTLLGGNLKILTTLIGTELHPKLDNAILIIEETNEKGYAIMRDLVHMRQAGLLRNVKAIIFGDFIGGNEIDGKNNVEDTLNYFVHDIETPCFRIQDFGHGAVNNPTILGAMATIDDNSLIISNPF